MRRWVVVAAGALAVLAVAVAVITVIRDDRDPALKAAAEALGDGPVLHAIAREQITGGRRYDVATGRTRPYTSLYESWIDPERERVHAVQRSAGEVVGDEILPLDDFGVATTTATLVADYRRRLENGELRVARTGTIGGRNVQWLATTDETAGTPPYEAAVDAETHRLVRLRTIAKYLQTARDFELVESADREDADFTVDFGPPADRAGRGKGTPVTPAQAARMLVGTQWAGRRVGGLPLREIRASDAVLTVAYGADISGPLDPEVGTPTGIEVVQAAADGEARWFLGPKPATAAPPPEGTFEVGGEFGKSGQFEVARLRKPGVWILVRAPSRRLLFEAVRSLRPIS
jgi:hypothetical protein